MTQKVETELTDDLDGGRADETVTFALGGECYEIVLATANADRLRDALEPYIAAGRRVRKNGKRALNKRRSTPGNR
ncbi:histone-like nucleoid-structuring protein Lsr2 [Streptomyces sp. NEAU-Y11]|uniref:histone-like nucleoid-structuring protein Lsr2 n=1 Tax=Streptomyces cucumeris TaxID=2962890 RepID=UPI0027E5808C|nr:Lsr2 family protein [Streptomyces sp. NEAU-Y11]